jgi:hypothetical protein
MSPAPSMSTIVATLGKIFQEGPSPHTHQLEAITLLAWHGRKDEPPSLCLTRKTGDGNIMVVLCTTFLACGVTVLVAPVLAIGAQFSTQMRRLMKEAPYVLNDAGVLKHLGVSKKPWHEQALLLSVVVKFDYD